MSEPRKRGRPKGRTDYQQIAVYLTPEMVQRLDEIAEKREAEQGVKTSRVNLIREAITRLIQQETSS